MREKRKGKSLLKGNLVIALWVQRIKINVHELFPKCTFKHLYGIASSLHKPKTPLFPKSCILYLTKRTFCICFLQNGLFGLEKLKQTGTYILANIKFYSPTQKSLSLIISSSSSSFFHFFILYLKIYE